MKAERRTLPPPPFEPVILTLETQAEVDALFAVCNNYPLNNAIGLTDNAYKALQPFAKDYQRIHGMLCTRFQ